jgi:hypothetical protein
MVRVESVCRCRELCRSADWMDVMLLLDVDDVVGCPDVTALPIDADVDDESGETTTTLVEASSSDSEVGYSLAASGGGGCDCRSIVLVIRLLAAVAASINNYFVHRCQIHCVAGRRATMVGDGLVPRKEVLRRRYATCQGDSQCRQI